MNSRTMLALPVIARGQLLCRLPLCDATALMLADAILESDAERRTKELRAALAVDPALAVWAILNASARIASRTSAGNDKLTISGLADLLSTKLPHLLEPVVDQRTLEMSNDQHRKLSELVAISVGVAYQIARTDRLEDILERPDFLGALSRRWPEWLAGSERDQAPTEITIDWPTRVDDVLVRTNSELDSQSRGKADAAWRRWLEDIPAARSLLPAIVEQQRHMQMLELEFDQRLQAAKLDSLKEFAYGAGHELNNPLANIASRAQTLLREESDPERRRRLTAINTQAFRAHEMLADMMLYARPPKLTPKQADLVSLIGEVLAELNETAAEQKTSLHGPLRREPLWIEIDTVQIRVALKALIMNAIEALGSDGNVTIELEATDVGESATDDDSEEAVRITVMDDGPGVPVELHDKLFDPFFSGREANRGLGFGLCKCWRIVTSHGGWIELQSGLGSGTSVTMTFPVGRALRPSALST